MFPDPSPRKTRSRSRILSGNSNVSGTTRRASPRHTLSDTHTISTNTIMKVYPFPDSTATVERKPRHKMTDFQLQKLEELFRENTHPSRDAKESLATEVGMSLKSVLIWFQNRRQDRRKRSTATNQPRKPSTKLKRQQNKSLYTPGTKPKAKKGRSVSGIRVHTPPSVSRHVAAVSSSLADSAEAMDIDPPSSITMAQTPSFLRLPASCLSHSMSTSGTLGSDGGAPQLWKVMPTSSFLTRRQSPEASRPLARRDNVILDLDLSPSLSAPKPKPKPDLEWACANSAARRQHGLLAYRDEDDSAGESSELEAEFARGRSRPRAAARRRQRMPVVSVPREYHALFSPDVVLGASLLLTLKHSADIL